MKFETLSGFSTGVRRVVGRTSLVAVLMAGGLGVVLSSAASAAGSPTTLVLTTQPSAAQTTGKVLRTQPVIKVEDDNGVVVKSISGSVTATVASGNGTLTNSSAAIVKGVAKFKNLAITGTAGSYILAFDSVGLTGVTSNAIDVTVGVQHSRPGASTVSFTGTSSVLSTSSKTSLSALAKKLTPGASVTITGYAPSSTAVANSRAKAVAKYLGGLVSLHTVIKTVKGTTARKVVVSTIAQAATNLVLTTSPSATASNGVALATQPTVTVEDSLGDVVTTATGTVTASASGSGSLASSTASIVHGVATFSGLVLNGIVGNYTLTFSKVGVADATSDTIALSAGVAAALAITTAPAGASSGVALTTQPVVAIEDAGGNVVTSQNTGTVTAAIATGSGTLTNVTSGTFSAGYATFASLTLTGTSGTSDSITFTSSVGSFSVTSSLITVSAKADATNSTVVASPLAVTPNGTAASTITVTLLSASSQPVSGKLVTLVASSGSSAFTPTGTSNVNGVVTFSVTDLVAQSVTYTATDTTDAVAISQTATVSFVGDGVGSISASTAGVVALSGGNTITFTYTAASAMAVGAQVSVTVPSGWSVPQTSSSTSAGYVTSSSGTVSIVSTNTILVTLTSALSASNTITIVYGSGSGTATAPVAGLPQTWTTLEKSTPLGTLTGLSSSPSITVGGDGLGTMTANTATVLPGSSHAIIFTYTATSPITLGAVTLAIPTGWTAPATTAGPGYVTVTGSTTTVVKTVASQLLTISNVSLATNGTLTITYGSGGTAVATNTVGAATWTTQEKSSAAGTLTSLASSPSINVTPGDGLGTMVSSTSGVVGGSSANQIVFTYTASAAMAVGAKITLAVPTGWTAPATSAGAGYTTSSSGTVTVSSQLITVTLTSSLASSGTITVTYGSGNTATAPAVGPAQTWTTQQESTSGGSLTTIVSSPLIALSGDGLGTMTASPTSFLQGSGNNTIVFTYTSASLMASGSKITLQVPTGWDLPVITPLSDPGYTVANIDGSGDSTSNVTITGVGLNIITVTLTSALASGHTIVITYGSTTGGGLGATAPATVGSAVWTTQQKSTLLGTLTTIASSPIIAISDGDGQGSMTTPTSHVFANSTGNSLVFTYTAAGPMAAGAQVTLTVPTGWSAPSTSPSANGYTIASINGVAASTSNVSVNSQTITVTLPALLTIGQTIVITYGSRAGTGAGATASSTVGDQTWTATEKGSAGGTLTALGGSPLVNVSALDGVGTMTTTTTTVLPADTGQTIVFTYTATAALQNGAQVTLTVPAGWSVPSANGSDKGYSVVSFDGAAAVTIDIPVSGTITVTVGAGGLAVGHTIVITYGSTTGGGPGATAPSAVGATTWVTQENSWGGGTLTDLASSPSINVTPGDGLGTMTSTTTTLAHSSTGHTIVFTYTAEPAGMAVGAKITLTVPTGWSAPSTSSSAAGYVTCSPGCTVTVVGQVITITLTSALAGSGVLTITYGDTTGTGTGAATSGSVVSSPGQTWAVMQESTPGGTLTAIVASPKIILT